MKNESNKTVGVSKKLERILMWAVASFFLLCGPKHVFSQFWQQTNASKVGVVRSIVINQSGYIFAGTDGGGVS